MNSLNHVLSEIPNATTALLSSCVPNLSAAELLSTLETTNEVFERGQKKTKKGHRKLVFQVFQRT